MIPLLSPFAYLLKAGLDLFKGNRVAVIAIAVSLILIFFQVQSCNRNKRLKKELAVAEHNLKAANDTIRVVLDRVGKEELNKLAFLTDKVSKLEELNQELYAEVKNIKGRVSTIIKSDIKIVHDTVPLIVKGELIDSVVRTDFDFSKQYGQGNGRKLAGYTKFDLRNGYTSGTLTQDEITMRFTTGIKNLDKGKPEIFLKSDYPGFTATGLEGAVLDPKLFASKKKVPLITVGVGVGWVPITYDIGSKVWSTQLDRVGVSGGINVNILKLIKGN